MSDRFLIQTAAAHLAVAIRLLDRAGLNVAAAHASASLESFANELARRKASDGTEENLDFSDLEAIIELIHVANDRITGKSDTS